MSPDGYEPAPLQVAELASNQWAAVTVYSCLRCRGLVRADDIDGHDQWHDALVGTVAAVVRDLDLDRAYLIELQEPHE